MTASQQNDPLLGACLALLGVPQLAHQRLDAVFAVVYVELDF